MQNFKKHSEGYVIALVMMLGIFAIVYLGQSGWVEAKKGEGIVYEPYSGVTDHCVTDASGVTNRSLYDILQTIGTSRKATVKFKNDNESGSTTAYKVVSASGGNFASYSNVYFEFEPGAMLESGVTLSGVTLPAPANIIAQPNQQIISGTSLFFSKAGEVNPSLFGLSESGTTSANRAALESGVSAAATGSVIKIDQGIYSMTGIWTINKAVKVSGYKVKLDWDNDTLTDRGIRIKESNITIEGLELDGPQHAAGVPTQIGISAAGSDSSNYLSNIKIRDCKITDWYYGIHFLFVEDFEITRNHVHALYQSGIGISSSQNGVITENIVEDIDTPVGGGKYGIYASRTADDSLVTYPISRRLVISKNIVKDITTWEALDTHGGHNIVFSDNVVNNCYLGISISPTTNAASEEVWAPKDIQIIGNTLNSGVTDGSYFRGINIAGAYNAGVIELASGIVVKGNTLRGYGLDSSASGAAIFTRTTSGLIISGNVIIEPSRHGIYVDHSSRAFSITGNAIIDPWSATGSAGMGVRIYGGTTTYGLIDNNTFSKESKSGVSVLSTALRIDPSVDTFAKVGKNYSQGADVYITDTYGQFLKGLTSGAGISTSGAGEDTLMSFYIPANMAASYNKMKIHAVGESSGTTGTKTVTFYLGSTSWNAIPAANNTNKWVIDVDCVFSGLNSQRVNVVGISGTTIVYNQYNSSTVDLTSGTSTLVKFTGECSDATGDVIKQYMMNVEVE